MKTTVITSTLALVLASISLTSSQTLAQTESSELTQWQEKAASNPNSALAQFNLGVLYQKAQKWKAAVDAYDKVIALKSTLAPVAIYYKALVYEQNNRLEVARKLINQIDLNTVPDNFKQSIIDYKAKLNPDEAPKAEPTPAPTTETPAQEPTPAPTPEPSSFSASFDVSVGGNTNPSSTNDTSVSGYGTDAAQITKGGAGYSILADKTSDLRFDYYFYGSFYTLQTSSNYYSHTVSLPYSYYIDDYRFKISPEFTKDFYGGTAYSESAGGRLEASVRNGDSYFGVSYQAANLTNKTSSYTYLSGSQNQAQMYFENRSQEDRLLVSISATQYKYLDTTSYTSSYTSNPVGLTYTRYLGFVDMTFTLGYDSKTYAKAASSAYQARKDNKITAGIYTNHAFTNNLMGYLDLQTVSNSSNYDNTSTTGNYNYKGTTAMLGLSWWM